jgi:hypothetical protein
VFTSDEVRARPYRLFPAEEAPEFGAKLVGRTFMSQHLADRGRGREAFPIDHPISRIEAGTGWVAKRVPLQLTYR